MDWFWICLRLFLCHFPVALAHHSFCTAKKPARFSTIVCSPRNFARSHSHESTKRVVGIGFVRVLFAFRLRCDCRSRARVLGVRPASWCRARSVRCCACVSFLLFKPVFLMQRFSSTCTRCLCRQRRRCGQCPAGWRRRQTAHVVWCVDESHSNARAGNSRSHSALPCFVLGVRCTRRSTARQRAAAATHARRTKPTDRKSTRLNSSHT